MLNKSAWKIIKYGVTITFLAASWCFGVGVSRKLSQDQQQNIVAADNTSQVSQETQASHAIIVTDSASTQSSVNAYAQKQDIEKLYVLKETTPTELWNQITFISVDNTQTHNYIISNELYNALSTAAATQKFFFDVDAINVSSEKLQANIDIYITDQVLNAIDQECIDHLEDMTTLKTLMFKSLDNPNKQNLTLVINELAASYPDIFDKVSVTLFNRQSFDTWYEEQRSTLAIQYDKQQIINKLYVYDLSGNYKGVYDDRNYAELQVLGEYIQQAIDAQIHKINYDKHVEIALSLFIPTENYRPIDVVSDQTSYKIINDLEKDVLLIKHIDGTEQIIFSSALQIDRDNCIEQYQGPQTDTYYSYTDIPNNKNITNYIDKNKIVILSEYEPTKVIQFTQDTEYIYNDTKTTVMVTTGTTDPNNLTPALYTFKLKTGQSAQFNNSALDSMSFEIR